MGLSREKINELLREYNANKGRCEYLQVEIKHIETRVLRESGHQAEASAYQPMIFSDMPTGKGRVGDPTSKLAIAIADQTQKTEWGAELVEFENELYLLLKLCAVVDAWMIGLPQRERWVIRTHVIDGRYWRELPDLYHREFGEGYTQEGLKAIKRRAIDLIEAMTMTQSEKRERRRCAQK